MAKKILSHIFWCSLDVTLNQPWCHSPQVKKPRGSQSLFCSPSLWDLLHPAKPSVRGDSGECKCLKHWGEPLPRFLCTIRIHITREHIVFGIWWHSLQGSQDDAISSPHSLANIWGSFGFPQSLNSGESSPKLITMMMMMINDDSYYYDDETMTMIATLW